MPEVKDTDHEKPADNSNPTDPPKSQPVSPSPACAGCLLLAIHSTHSNATVDETSGYTHLGVAVYGLNPYTTTKSITPLRRANNHQREPTSPATKAATSEPPIPPINTTDSVRA